MTFDQYLAAYALGKVRSSDLPDLGVQALTEGYDSVDLAVLAGSTSRSASPRELEELFFGGLRQLDKVIPSRAEAGRVLRDYYASLVATGAMSPRTGGAELVKLIDELGGEFPSQEYVGDGLGLARIYGLYDSYDDVKDGDDQSHREIDDEIKKACEELLDQRSV
ncbi:MAG TPA: hypothetical protein VGR31_05080 [Planctomycetota bacterium]|jgi:hypothetical protein|nr:hypothetical protein [Planctomycetota bacterium]